MFFLHRGYALQKSLLVRNTSLRKKHKKKNHQRKKWGKIPHATESHPFLEISFETNSWRPTRKNSSRCPRGVPIFGSDCHSRPKTPNLGARHGGEPKGWAILNLWFAIFGSGVGFYVPMFHITQTLGDVFSSPEIEANGDVFNSNPTLE